MKKKVLVILLVLALAMTSVFAANTKGAAAKNSFGIGLEAGTNSGVALRWGLGNVDLQADVGFAIFNKCLAVDFGAAYNFATVQFRDGAKSLGSMPFTTGPMAGLNIHFGDQATVTLDALWMVSMGYDFANVPISLFLRVGLGASFVFSPSFAVDFGYSAAIGGLWTF